MSAYKIYSRFKKFSTFNKFSVCVWNHGLQYLGVFREILDSPIAANFNTLGYVLNCKEGNTNEKHLNKKKDRIFIRSDGSETKKITSISPKILVVYPNGSKTSMYLEKAEKLAKHNNWKLQLTDDKSKKKVYALVSDGTSIKLNKKKFDKKIVFGLNILPNDFEIKMKQVAKLLEKGKFLRVTIEGRAENTEKTLKTFKERLGTNVNINVQGQTHSSIILTAESTGETLNKNDTDKNIKEVQNLDNLDENNASNKQ